MDRNLDVLEDRAAGGARRYGKIVAIAAGLAATGAVGLIMWRRMRRPPMKERLDTMRHGLRRLRRSRPSVKVVVGEREEPGVVESIVRKVGPAVAGTVAAGLVERLARPPETEPE